MFQRILTPAAGKRLIAKAVARVLSESSVAISGTIVVVAGTTNGYIAEELLAGLGQGEGFRRDRFFRGITLPPGYKTTEQGRLPDESAFPGDLIIRNGKRLDGQTIFDVVETLAEGDVIVKGANAVDLVRRRAGILIGHPKGGTILAALQAVVGRRVRLILPVGLEKRVADDLDSIAALLNAPGGSGSRFMPVPGEVVTELDAIRIISGANARLVAAGGVCGAEGAVWISVEGDEAALGKARAVLDTLVAEPKFQF